MKRHTLIVAAALACSACMPEYDSADYKAKVNAAADIVVDTSVIRCKDGNQLRVSVLSPEFRSDMSAAVWPILDSRTGRPKTCVRRDTDRSDSYEPVADPDNPDTPKVVKADDPVNNAVEPAANTSEPVENNTEASDA